MNKVLATDLDGTLFYPRDRKRMIRPKNLKCVRQIVDDGNELILISGRSYDFLKRVQQIIDRPCTFICYNGALISSNDVILKDKNIENSLAKKIIDDFFDLFKLPAVFVMTTRGVFVKLRRQSKFVDWLYRFIYKMQKAYAETFSAIKEDFDKELNEGKIYKIMFFFGLRKKKKLKAAEYTSHLRENYDYIEANWSDTIIELTDANITKSNSLVEYLNLKNIDKDKVCVVGDSGNDISMFKEFYENSYCMNNGFPSVKKHAKHVLKKWSDISSFFENN